MPQQAHQVVFPGAGGHMSAACPTDSGACVQTGPVLDQAEEVVVVPEGGSHMAAPCSHMSAAGRSDGGTCAQTGPMLERVEEVVLGLTRMLDARVYVALGRGLWDFTAKDVYEYVESLQEDRHNKVRTAVFPPGPASFQIDALPSLKNQLEDPISSTYAGRLHASGTSWLCHGGHRSFACISTC